MWSFVLANCWFGFFLLNFRQMLTVYDQHIANIQYGHKRHKDDEEEEEGGRGRKT